MVWEHRPYFAVFRVWNNRLLELKDCDHVASFAKPTWAVAFVMTVRFRSSYFSLHLKKRICTINCMIVTVTSVKWIEAWYVYPCNISPVHAKECIRVLIKYSPQGWKYSIYSHIMLSIRTAQFAILQKAKVYVKIVFSRKSISPLFGTQWPREDKVKTHGCAHRLPTSHS